MKVEFIWHDDDLPQASTVAAQFTSGNHALEWESTSRKWNGFQQPIDDQGATVQVLETEVEQVGEIEEIHGNIWTYIGFEPRVLIDDKTLLKFLTETHEELKKLKG